MLVLARKLDERVILRIPGFNDVIIAITDIDRVSNRPRVRLGFSADPSIVILREEIDDDRNLGGSS